MFSEIGSNFWLNPSQDYQDKPIGTPQQFNCQGSDFVWLSNGRSAIKLVIQTIEKRNIDIKKIAVLPSFTCNTVFEPFLEAGYEIYYYPVDYNLVTTSETILKTVVEKDASVVLFHRYFGFETLDDQVDKLCNTLRQLGKYSIEDCTQCLYSDIDRADSDFTVGSIRKWTGVPDGGFAVCRNGYFLNKPHKPDVRLENAKIEASYAKYHFLYEHVGDKADILEMYRFAEDILNQQSDIYAISKTSMIVQSNLDVLDLQIKRKSNYKQLSALLEGPITQILKIKKGNEVPLYFPILVEDRASLQRHLVQNAIYAPVVWPKDEYQPQQCNGAENAYKHLLCIPIDQRYNADDMNRIVDVINHFYNI